MESLPPKTPHKQKDLSRDTRIKAQTLRDLGWTYSKIAAQLHISLRQVQWAVTHRPTPQKHTTGRPLKINAASRQILIEFVCASRKNQQLPFWKIPLELGWDVSADCIPSALKKEGFSKRLARRKPPLSEQNQRTRLAWAYEHLDWTFEEWESILWSDETWVNGTRHRRIWVTRRKDEAYEPTCVVPKLRGKGGWMFWACFAGSKKGPCVFWEKEWGTINKESCCEHIVPIIDGWIRHEAAEGVQLQFMQDNAPGHAATTTQAELQERGIRVIFWPPYSPDLNPIEEVWNIMKDWIQEHYGDEDRLSYDSLRKAIREAWNAVGEDQLRRLIGEMRERCQAVINAKGGHTQY